MVEGISRTHNAVQPDLQSDRTDNGAIVTMGVWVLVVDWFLEIGRTSNIFAGSTLRATGDTVYPFVVGVILVRRWRSGKWRTKGFVR